MSELPRDGFLISAQYGDIESAAAIRPNFRAIKAALRADVDAIACEHIHQFAYVLRVSGSITSFEFEGCEKIDLNRRKHYISIDVGVPMVRWKDKTDTEIAQYLVNVLPDGLEQMLARLRTEKIVCDEAVVRGLFAQGIARYLAGWSTASDAQNRS